MMYRQFCHFAHYAVHVEQNKVEKPDSRFDPFNNKGNAYN